RQSGTLSRPSCRHQGRDRTTHRRAHNQEVCFFLETGLAPEPEFLKLIDDEFSGGTTLERMVPFAGKIQDEHSILGGDEQGPEGVEVVWFRDAGNQHDQRTGVARKIAVVESSPWCLEIVHLIGGLGRVRVVFRAVRTPIGDRAIDVPTSACRERQRGEQAAEYKADQAYGLDSNWSFNQVRQDLLVCRLEERLIRLRAYPPPPSSRDAPESDWIDLEHTITADVESNKVAVVDEALDGKHVVVMQIEKAVRNHEVYAGCDSGNQSGD